jgi:phosphotransferase system HPr (HPr) family protein
MTVLLVEDSKPVRQRLCAMMAETPALRVVAEAGTVAEATDMFDSVRPETVVLDLALPDGSGMDVLRHIRGVGDSCLVLVLTNYAGPESRRHCCELGANYVFGKSDEFESALETLGDLSRRRADRATGAQTPRGVRRARLVVTSLIGLHSGPAATLVRQAQAFDSELELAFNGRQADAKSILDVLLLHAEYGAEVTLTASGDDADMAVNAITDIFASNFTEPQQAPAPEARQRRPLNPRLPQGKGETILIADDDPIVLKLVKTILEANGYRTVTARDGKEAVAAFSAAGNIAAVITDMRMPKMNGVDAMFVMRRARPRLPILAMSGASGPFALPSDDDTVFMKKPFGSAELLPTVRALLDRAEAVSHRKGVQRPAAGEDGNCGGAGVRRE